MSASPVPETGSAPGGPFAALGRFAVRRRWAIVVAWIALLAIALPFAPRAGDALRAGGFILDDLESARAKAVLQTELGAPPSAVVVVLHSDSLVAGTPAFEAAAAEAIAGVADAPYVARVVPHSLATRQVSADGHTAYDIVLLTIAPDDSPAALPGIEAALRHPAGFEVALAGGPAFYGDVQAVSESDLQRSELISLPLAALALLVVFGSVVAAALPLAVGGAAVVVALAAVYGMASGDADEHLRPEPGDAARAGARGGLLAAAHQPVPRGAGRRRSGRDRPRAGAPSRRRSRPPDGRSSSRA